MSNVRLHKVLLGQYTTEKSVRVAENHKHVVFKVSKDANKIEVKSAIEKLFEVVVKSVNIVNVKGKTKRFKQKLGSRKSWKKAYVMLEEGHDINVANFE